MKPRPSILDSHAGDLDLWFRDEKITLKEAAERLKPLGCSVSASRLSQWWAQRQKLKMQADLLANIASGGKFCSELDAAFARNPPPETENLIKMLRVIVMQLAVQGSADSAVLNVAANLTRAILDWAKILEKRADRDFGLKKFHEAMRSKLEAGLDELAAAFKANPEAMRFYQQARELVGRETQ